MSDTAIRRLTAATVLLVAAIAAVVSYEHLYHLSITHGEPRLDAALIPVATDGTVVAASLVMLRAARLGLPTPWLARLMLVLAAATTLAANAAFGWSYAIWGVVLAACPVVWFIGNAESVIAFGRKTRKSAPPASVGASVPASVKPKLPKLREVQDGRYSGVACSQPTTEKIQAALRTRDREWAQAIERSRGDPQTSGPGSAPAAKRGRDGAPPGVLAAPPAGDAVTPPMTVTPAPAGAFNGQAHGS